MRSCILILLILLTACGSPSSSTVMFATPVPPTPHLEPLSAEEQTLAALLYADGDLPASYTLVDVHPPGQLWPSDLWRAGVVATWWIPPDTGRQLQVSANLARYQTTREAHRVYEAMLESPYWAGRQPRTLGELGMTHLKHFEPGNQTIVMFTIRFVRCDTLATLSSIRTEDSAFLLDYAERLDARLKATVCPPAEP